MNIVLPNCKSDFFKQFADLKENSSTVLNLAAELGVEEKLIFENVKSFIQN